MRNSRISATWLSDGMAHALAAMWPPLEATDVMRAADELTWHAGPADAVNLLLDDDSKNDSGQAIERGVVEALRALHDLRA
jgi:hypothetical protein